MFKKWIGAICPKLCPTRWTNIFDILSFLMKHLQRIICIANTENPIVKNDVDSFRHDLYVVLFEVLPNLYGFMYLYNKLIHVLENDSTLAAECPIIYEEFFEKVQTFIMSFNDKHIEALGHIFMKSIKKRLLETGNFSLLLFISTFIYEGRELVRRKCSNIETNSFNEELYSINTQYFHYFDNESDNISYFVQNEYAKILQAKQYTENNQRTYDLIEILKNETISSSDYDDDMESDDNLISLSYEAMNNLTESEDDSNFSNDSNDNEFVPNLYDQYSTFYNGIEFLQEYSSNNLFTESKRIKINEMYIQWMISPVSNILKWQRIFQKPMIYGKSYL